MTVKIRKQIYIEPEQDRQLKRLARRADTSEAEIIRQAIDHYVSDVHHPKSGEQAWDEILAFIDQRMALPAVDSKRAWTRDELHDR